MDADLQLRRKRPLGDLAVERRAGQSGAGEDGLEADDSPRGQAWEEHTPLLTAVFSPRVRMTMLPRRARVWRHGVAFGIEVWRPLSSRGVACRAPAW